MNVLIDMFPGFIILVWLGSIAWIFVIQISFVARSDKQKSIDKFDQKRTLKKISLVSILSGFFGGLMLVLLSEPSDQIELYRGFSTVPICMGATLIFFILGFLVGLCKMRNLYSKDNLSNE